MQPILLDLLQRHAAARPDAPCLTFEAERPSYRDLDERSTRLANALAARGVRSGDRVALVARTTPVHFELFFAAARLGAISLPINWRLSPREVAAILADAAPALLIVDAELQALLSACAEGPERIDLDDYPAWRDAASAEPVNRSPDPHEPVLLLYTSGTTGLPKGVTISHANLSYIEPMAREVWGFGASSVNLCAMPLFHIGGIGYGMMALSQGGHTVLLQQPSPPAVLDAIARHGVTHAFFVPAVVQTLVDHPGVDAMPLQSLERIMYGAAPISETLLDRAIAVFGCGFNHAYGMTETAGTVITLAPEEHEGDRLRSCGRPVPWVELELVDPATGKTVATGEVGEIRLRTPMNMLGYWNKPAETAATVTPEGWLCTGDAATRDAEGFVYIHDRYKDMIVSGGENIYPTEVENALARHPGITEVAVIGVPHERWGETPKAFVVPREGHTLTEAELITFTQGQIARYKCPTSVAFVPALPRNASGKILKREMRGEAWLKAQS